MQYYTEAAKVYDEFSGLSEENLTLVLQRPASMQSFLNQVLGPGWWSQKREHVLYDDTIEPGDPVHGKDFQNGLDPVRNYLTNHAQSFSWKRTNTVLESIYGFLDERAAEYNQTNAASVKQFRARIEEIASQMGLQMDAVIKWRFSDDVRLGVTAEELLGRFLEATAIIVRPLGSAGQPRVVVGWSFSKGFLDELIKWRHQFKRRLKRRPGQG